STRSLPPPADMWAECVAYLRLASEERSPAEKLGRVMQCSRSITAALTAAAGDKLPGADDFLPALILCVVHANPEAMQSNLDYIQAFAREGELISEAGYVLTHLCSAVQFVLHVEQSSLSISKEEFEAGLARCRREMERAAAAPPPAPKREKREELEERLRRAGVAPAGGALEEVTARQVREMRERGEPIVLEGAGGRGVDGWIEDALGGREDGVVVGPAGGGGGSGGEAKGLPAGVEKRRYTFLGAEPDTIRLHDLPNLLREYKDLVRAVEILRNERSGFERERERVQLELKRKELELRYRESRVEGAGAGAEAGAGAGAEQEGARATA
ncbi:hypothetical protein TeGR_g12570, partial [Tetraparma gracilis]